MFYAKEINADIAKSAWHKAVNVSLFCYPTLLDKLGYNVRYFGGYKNKKLLVVWPLVQTQDGFIKPPAFSYYFGPYWVESEYSDVPYKMYRNNLEVFNVLIPLVEKNSKSVSFSLVPEFLDLRPLLWWNYHNPEANKFHLSLRYTARYQFKEKINSESLALTFRADDKRKKFRRILKDNIFETSWGRSESIEFYTNFYDQTLKRSGAIPSNEEKQHLAKLIELAGKEIDNSVVIKLIEIFENGKMQVEGFQLLLIGKDQVYALAQCVSDRARKLNGNVYLTFKSLMYANEQRYTFDFNGANSPFRADDKHAFGAKLATYFDLELEYK